MAAQTNDYGNMTGGEGTKRRNPNDEKESNTIGPDDTVYRYLCPLRRIGSVIGVCGDIAKQLRAETNAKIRIGEVLLGCEERVVTIYSSSEETNCFGDDDDDLICPAQDALYKVHDRIVAEEVAVDDELEGPPELTIRLLVPSDQIGCVIGKGGQVVQSIRSDSGAQVRILSSEHLPLCGLNTDELIQIVGEANTVKKALYLVASRLHENPSRSQQSLLSSSSIYRAGNVLVHPGMGVPLAGSLVGPYRGYRSAGGDHSAMKEFSLRFVCPAENVGAVIGKGGAVIKQIRQESGASIKVDTSVGEGEECIILVSAREAFEDASSTIDAAMRLQPRCSEKADKESDDPIIITRLLVPSSRIGCLIGKGGAIINEMRSITRATIRIFSDENLPNVASEDDEMLQITGDLNVASTALLQVLMRLRGNLFEMDGPLASGPYVDRRSQGHSRYSESYGVYGSPQTGGRSGYGGYGGYSNRSSGGSGQNHHSH